MPAVLHSMHCSSSGACLCFTWVSDCKCNSAGSSHMAQPGREHNSPIRSISTALSANQHVILVGCQRRRPVQSPVLLLWLPSRQRLAALASRMAIIVCQVKRTAWHVTDRHGTAQACPHILNSAGVSNGAFTKIFPILVSEVGSGFSDPRDTPFMHDLAAWLTADPSTGINRLGVSVRCPNMRHSWPPAAHCSLQPALGHTVLFQLSG